MPQLKNSLGSLFKNSFLTVRVWVRKVFLQTQHPSGSGVKPASDAEFDFNRWVPVALNQRKSSFYHLMSEALADVARPVSRGSQLALCMHNPVLTILLRNKIVRTGSSLEDELF